MSSTVSPLPSPRLPTSPKETTRSAFYPTARDRASCATAEAAHRHAANFGPPVAATQCRTVAAVVLLGLWSLAFRVALGNRHEDHPERGLVGLLVGASPNIGMTLLALAALLVFRGLCEVILARL
jgi:hypothetical protein